MAQTEIVLQTRIHAPAERCFDLARSIDFHLQSASSTKEQAIGGVTSGLINADEEVEWKARHLGLWFKMRVRITSFEPPRYFQDTMVKGPLRSFTHDHIFEPDNSSTLMTDRINFRSLMSWVGPLLDRGVLRGHLLRFVQVRNAQLKMAAETNTWQPFLQNQAPDRQ